MSIRTEALLAAADWLEQNRQRHIQGALFCDSNGKNLLDVTDPANDERICGFCALGIVAKECGVIFKTDEDGDVEQDYQEIARAAGFEGPDIDKFEMIYGTNDSGLNGKSELCRNRDLGNTAVINRIRQFANGDF